MLLAFKRSVISAQCKVFVYRTPHYFSVLPDAKSKGPKTLELVLPLRLRIKLLIRTFIAHP